MSWSWSLCAPKAWARSWEGSVHINEFPASMCPCKRSERISEIFQWRVLQVGSKHLNRLQQKAGCSSSLLEKQGTVRTRAISSGFGWWTVGVNGRNGSSPGQSSQHSFPPPAPTDIKEVSTRRRTEPSRVKQENGFKWVQTPPRKSEATENQ